MDVLTRLTDPRQTGQDKWQCKCPAHDDGTASLSVSRNNGKWLFHCHAGCSPEVVLHALNLTFKDVSGDHQIAEQTIEYKYHSGDGEHVYSAMRFPGKQFRQKTAAGEWSMKGVARVPYNLPSVIESDVVYIVEGEKDAETLRRCGLVATTNIGGAGKWDRSFQQYFVGKTVYILPDNDEAGANHATDVVAKLGHGTIVELPGLSPKGDVSDWFRDGGNREQLEQLVEAAKLPKNTEAPDTTPINPGKSEVVSQKTESKSQKTQIPELHEFVPFPTDMLPKPLDEFVRQAAKSICCDESFVALPLLAGLASAIGNTYGLLIKRSWVVPSILWSVVVAESGVGKTAPQRLALRPIHARQKRLLKDYDKAWEQHLRDHEVYMRDLADFKKSKDALKEPPEAPIEPVCPRVVVNDTTIEALAKRLKDNPRGILCATDELAGWFGGFNRYKSGKGGEESKWLEFSNAQTSIVDRSSSPRPLVIDKASVSVTGTIQPGILRKHLTAEHKASGMAARLLFTMPPRIQKRWVEDEIDEDVEDQVTDIFDELFKLEMKVCDDGSLDTNLIRLSHDAKQLFVGFYNRHNGEQQQLDGDLFAAFSKLEEYAARFALVIHCVRYAAGDVASLTQLDVNSMMLGIELCQWFKSEAKRVYSVLSECEVANENRKLLSWIQNNGGETTPRDFHRAHRSVIDDSNAAETLLQQFVTAGYGEWEAIPTTDQGGRPSRKFTLTSLGQNPQNSRDLGGCVPEVSEEPEISAIQGEAWQP